MTTAHDLIDKSEYDNISRREKSNILQFFWLDVYHNLVDVKHSHIYIRGLGTFEVIWSRLTDLERIYNWKINRIKSNLRLTEEAKQKTLEDYQRILSNVKSRQEELKKLYEEKKKFKNGSQETIRNISEQGEDLGRAEEQVL
jgi:hypothetical protein